MKKTTIFCLVIGFSLLATHVFADETWRCTFGQDERIISVVYQDQEVKLPCEVRYEKNGITETLWSAQSEVGYCEEKAREFVDKQREWGWLCVEEGGAGS